MAESQVRAVPASLSIIIPVRDEVENIGPLIAELEQFRAAQPWSTEVIVVDDGSMDGSWKAIRDAALNRRLLELNASDDAKARNDAIARGASDLGGVRRADA